MRTVPREAFVPEPLREFAYEDTPLPIEAGQTISQLYIVARMIEEAAVAPGDRVLEIVRDSGYAAAALGRIADRVYENVQIRVGDGTRGWPEAAPFDAILIAAGSPSVPQPVCGQLAIGGRLVMPIGDADQQRLVRVVRTGERDFDEQGLGAVRFVPLIGAHGWASDAGSDARTEPQPLPALIRDAADQLPDLDDPAFGRLFDRFADARVIPLGKASHGTSEFYRAPSRSRLAACCRSPGRTAPVAVAAFSIQEEANGPDPLLCQRSFDACGFARGPRGLLPRGRIKCPIVHHDRNWPSNERDDPDWPAAAARRLPSLS